MVARKEAVSRIAGFMPNILLGCIQMYITPH